MDLLALWQRAAAAEIGIGIETDDLRRLSAELYLARKDHPEYHGIRVCHPAGGKEVWLVKQGVEILDGR